MSECLPLVFNSNQLLLPYGPAAATPYPSLPSAPTGPSCLASDIDSFPIDPVLKGKNGPGNVIACPQCKKTFKRPCDFNRHKKTHTRPHKCSVTDCKYHERGFPTFQECQRHFDDCHSTEPPVFKCQLESCTFQAKRESNCKQHMAKRHNIEYQPTHKSHRPSHRSFMTHDVGNAAVAFVPKPSPTQYPTGDFTLFPGQQPVDMSPIIAARVVYPDDDASIAPMSILNNADRPSDQSTESNSFVPWESPSTQQKEISNIIREVHSSFVPQQPLDDNGSQPLSRSTYPSSIAWQLVDPALVRSAPSDGFIDTQLGNVAYTSPEAELEELPEPLPFLSLSSDTTGAVRATGYSEASGNQSNFSQAAQSSHPPQPSPAVGLALKIVKRDLDEDDSDNEDDSDGDDDPPRKKPKIGSKKDEGQMTCPFRFTEPDYFNRENEERFSPCHTLHRRHLERPAHRLVVGKSSISSFGIDEHQNPQPLAGLCRTCWASFHDEHIFKTHMAENQCHKVSNSSLDKYDIIMKTFCRLGAGTSAVVPVHQHQPQARTPAPLIRRNTRSSTRSNEIQAQVAVGPAVPHNPVEDNPGIKESPVQLQHRPPFGPEDEFVRRSEFEGLKNRIVIIEETLKRNMDNLIGCMDRQPDIKEGGDADASTGIGNAHATSGPGIREDPVQDVAGIGGEQQPHRTGTGLSSTSVSSSVRHMPPFKALQGDAMNQGSLQQQQEPDPQQTIVVKPSSDTVVDSGYYSSEAKASQHQDNNTVQLTEAELPAPLTNTEYMDDAEADTGVIPEDEYDDDSMPITSVDDGVQFDSMFE